MLTMFTNILFLLLMLIIILIAAEIFTNALEHLGHRFSFSEGVTASLFAAVGTALPETIIPILAIFKASANKHVELEIGMGAILGAPLMLSTLSSCLLGLAVISARSFTGALHPEKTGLKRDLDTFLIAYVMTVTAVFLTAPVIRYLISSALVLLYVGYIFVTVRASRQLVIEGHGTAADRKLFFAQFGISVNGLTITTQLLSGLILLVFAAKGFIHGVELVSTMLNITPLLLSLLIIPIATELPEKVNSILWIRRGKDTLAFGNITGAMVFQGTILPALGIAFTPWQARVEVLTAIAFTCIAALWLRLNIYRGRGLRVWHLIINGGLYSIYLRLTFYLHGG